MRRAVDYNIDLLVVILVMAITVPFLLGISVKLMRSDFGGFDTQIEKTAMETTAEIIPVAREIDRNDIMLMLAVADTYVQSPNVYNISGVVITIDTAYLANRTGPLMTAYAAMPDNVAKKMTLYIGPSGPRYWYIQND